MKTCTLTSLFIVAGLLLAGCAGNAPTPQSKSTAAPLVQRTATPAPPAIDIRPDTVPLNETDDRIVRYCQFKISSKCYPRAVRGG